jgi:hypothetical protein
MKTHEALRESALRTLGRVPIPEVVLSCGAADTALWLYAQGYDNYAVKTELRGYGFDAARYFAEIMRSPAGIRQNAELEAGQAGDVIAPDVPNADDPAAWHAVWAEEARSLVRTILRHRRAGNRDAAKAVRRLLPERLEWRKWTGTLTDRDRRHIAEVEALVYDFSPLAYENKIEGSGGEEDAGDVPVHHGKGTVALDNRAGHIRRIEAGDATTDELVNDALECAARCYAYQLRYATERNDLSPGTYLNPEAFANIEATRTLLSAVLRCRRQGNRAAARKIAWYLPDRYEWRRWRGTMTDNDRRQAAKMEALIADDRKTHGVTM